MRSRSSGTLLGLADMIGSTVILCSLFSPARAEMLLIDDFSDGNDDGWSRLDTSVGQSFGPGIYDLTNHSYRLGTTGIVDPSDNFFSYVASTWDASADPLYSNGYVRTRIRLDTEGSEVGNVFRLSMDQNGFTGYGFFASTIGPDGSPEHATVYARRLLDGVDTFVGSSEFGVGPGVGEDWWMEFGGVEDQLSIKVWPVGEPEPVDAQFSFTDSTISSGVLGVGAKLDSAALSPARVDATFDDISFTPGVPCDFDADGQCNVTDIDLMQALGPIAPGVPATGNEDFDLNEDGVIDLADRDEWLAIAATENGFGSPYKLGDANVDGVVDGQDFIAWNGSKFTSELLWSHGDFNADGVVDGQDFIIWNGNKFTSSDSLSTVPEPSMGILLAAALMGCWVVRRL